jgi:hypothetical protein
LVGKPLKTIGLLAGFGLLIVGVYLYLNVQASQFSQSPRPLVLPVSLRVGTIRTPEIAADLGRSYDIAVDLTRDAVVGQGRTLPSSLVSISWELFDHDKLIAEGDSEKAIWETHADTVEGIIGKFEGQSGRTYHLVLHVTRDASELDAANPRVIVQIPRGLWEDYGAGLFIRKVKAFIVGITGIVIVVLIALMRRRSRAANGDATGANPAL